MKKFLFLIVLFGTIACGGDKADVIITELPPSIADRIYEAKLNKDIEDCREALAVVASFDNRNPLNDSWELQENVCRGIVEASREMNVPWQVTFAIIYKSNPTFIPMGTEEE